MPDVTGARLDVAKSDIKRAGYDKDVEVVGGGAFGVVQESNWLVCEQLPASGQAVVDAPRLSVDRSCGDGGAGDEAAKPTDTTVSRDETTKESVAQEAPDPTVAPAGIDAQAMEQAFVRALDRPIENMCSFAANDPTWTNGPHWACYYDGVEAKPGYLQVNLTTPGDYTSEELEKMGNDTGRHWFNFIACDFPDLDMIVVKINSFDHNVSRSSTSADLTCN